jgi:hypothetical protein
MKCHQRIIREQRLETDLANLNFDSSNLKASDFSLNQEILNSEIIDFIKTYEWLGNIGTKPKWVFTARYNNLLGGVVLINEPSSYSNVLGKDTKKYEALIQRGACASWTPKNLGSRLIMFSCKEMVKITPKRAFVAYADSSANEVGTIYQACNFDYLGCNFGTKNMLIHPDFKKGAPFSKQSLYRTSTLKKWAKENNVKIEPSWIKENGFKDLSKIPQDVNKAWKNWINNIVKESEKIQISPKGKYILVLGSSKKDSLKLNSLKNYTPLPYPKRS